MSKSRNKMCIVKISPSVTNVIEEVIQQVRKQEGNAHSQHEHHERSRPQNGAFEAKSIYIVSPIFSKTNTSADTRLIIMISPHTIRRHLRR